MSYCSTYRSCVKKIDNLIIQQIQKREKQEINYDSLTENGSSCYFFIFYASEFFSYGFSASFVLDIHSRSTLIIQCVIEIVYKIRSVIELTTTLSATQIKQWLT